MKPIKQTIIQESTPAETPVRESLLEQSLKATELRPLENVLEATDTDAYHAQQGLGLCTWCGDYVKYPCSPKGGRNYDDPL
jgi:hypothetical protein